MTSREKIIKQTLTIIYYITFIIVTYHIAHDLASLKLGGNDSIFTQILSFAAHSILIYLLCIIFIVVSFFTKKFLYEELDKLVFHNPYTFPLLTLAALIAGIYTSVTSSEILAWLSPDSNQVISSKYGMGYFIFSFSILFVGFTKHGLFSAKADMEKQRVHSQSIAELEKVIRLAPPGNFSSQLSHYADIFEDWSSSVMLDELSSFQKKMETNSINTESEETEEEARDIQKDYKEFLEKQQNYIRACLIAFGRLAGMYDNASLGINAPTTYRVNLMLKAKPHIALNLDTLFSGDVKKHFFLKAGANVDYILQLKKQYSVVIDSDDKSLLNNGSTIVKHFQQDDTVNDIELPVYNLESDSDCYNCIGAPRAIQTCQPQFIRNTNELIEKWKNEEGAPRDLYEEAKTYYLADKKGKSIISFPLSTQRYASDSLSPDKMSGVLNIYRNSPDMFSGDDEKFYNFFHLTSPLLISLCRIVEYHLIALSFPPNE